MLVHVSILEVAPGACVFVLGKPPTFLRALFQYVFFGWKWQYMGERFYADGLPADDNPTTH